MTLRRIHQFRPPLETGLSLNMSEKYILSKYEKLTVAKGPLPTTKITNISINHVYKYYHGKSESDTGIALDMIHGPISIWS